MNPVASLHEFQSDTASIGRRGGDVVIAHRFLDPASSFELPTSKLVREHIFGDDVKARHSPPSRLRSIYDQIGLTAHRRQDPHHAAIEARVARLRTLTRASGDQFEEWSAERLLRFCHRLAADRKPAIFILLNGNLRAVWENRLQEQIGIQFLPEGKMQFVIFRLSRGELVETMGTELDGSDMEQRVHDLGLTGLWFRGEG